MPYPPPATRIDDYLNQQGWLYFVRCPENGRVRIGFTTQDPKGRFKALRTASPAEVVFVATVRARRRDEYQVQGRSGARHVWGEWYEGSPGMDAILAEAVAGTLRPDRWDIDDLREWLTADPSRVLKVARIADVSTVALRRFMSGYSASLRGHKISAVIAARTAMEGGPRPALPARVGLDPSSLSPEPYAAAGGRVVPCPVTSADAGAPAERARLAEALLLLAYDPALAQRVTRRGENDLVDKTLLLRLAAWVREGAAAPEGVTHG